jgi:hypothetical protein
LFSKFLKRLFKENEAKIEITFVDELNNTNEYILVMNLSKPYILSQLVSKLKSIWESEFYVDMRIFI